ncbi:MAG: hypothetical protein WC718_07235 [Phycisphaerales bacterium]|jgi:hypothetical protein
MAARFGAFVLAILGYDEWTWEDAVERVLGIVTVVAVLFLGLLVGAGLVATAYGILRTWP